MRLEIPDGFILQPLLAAMKHEAEQQGCHLTGEHDGRELVLILRPQEDAAQPSPQLAMELPDIGVAASASVTFNGPGLEVLARLDDPRNVIVNINQYRATRGGHRSAPPRVA